MPVNRQRVAQGGFSLVEMVVVIVVLALGLAGVTLVINRTVLQSPEALVQTRAMEIAQAYLDEIIAKRFDENSGQGGLPRCDSTDTNAQGCGASLGPDNPPETSRALYDDVDDYHGLSHSPPRALATGSALGNYSGFDVSVEVVLAGTELGYSDNARAKRVTVTVATARGNRYAVSAYRINF